MRTNQQMRIRVTNRPKIADDYLELINRFPLVPIRSRTHLNEAFKVIDALSIVDEEKLTPGQTDYLLVLTALVERYEDELDQNTNWIQERLGSPETSARSARNVCVGPGPAPWKPATRRGDPPR